MKFRGQQQLTYCTNIHPAETWDETFSVLKSDVLAVRDVLRVGNPSISEAIDPFGIGLRLSAVAAKELRIEAKLAEFSDWLQATDTEVFTINGFPYGGFHGVRVKEKVFQPDWTTPERMDYTKDLFTILANVARSQGEASVSTVPGSHKTFLADEDQIIVQLRNLAIWLEELSQKHGMDFHLGLEPEPLGMIENTDETLLFFEKLRRGQSPTLSQRIGVNYDTCHFSLEYDDPYQSLDRLTDAGIRLSKIHLSNAITLDPRDNSALAAIRGFEEPTYFHQVLIRRRNGSVQRFMDLPDFFQSPLADDAIEMRVHFHIPLDAEPSSPLASTRAHTQAVLDWTARHPRACRHFEIETYTWSVLPERLRRPMIEQIAQEYQWVWQHR